MKIETEQFTAEVTQTDERDRDTGLRLVRVDLTCGKCQKPRTYKALWRRNTGFKGAAIRMFDIYHSRCWKKPGKRVGGIAAFARVG